MMNGPFLDFIKITLQTAGLFDMNNSIIFLKIRCLGFDSLQFICETKTCIDLHHLVLNNNKIKGCETILGCFLSSSSYVITVLMGLPCSDEQVSFE